MYAEKSKNFIRQYPDFEYSARLILEIKDQREVNKLFFELGTKAKDSYFGNILKNMILGWSTTSPGMKFPGIEMNTIKGRKIDTDSLRGKYVLIDFWGSWCQPCLSEIPELKSLSNKYKDDLIILGIACNDNITKLQSAISENKIDWPQILEGKEKSTKYSTIFGIRSFPTKILINRDGIIVDTFIGVSDKNKGQLENIIKNNYRQHGQ